MHNTNERKKRSLNPKSCGRCGETFVPTGSNCRRCPKCRVEHQREQARLQHERHPERRHATGKGYSQKGENNNAWKGGRSPGYYRVVCFDTWGHKCFGCGGPAVIAHHRDENRTNNEPDNLTPLCKRCHQLLHACQKNLPKPRTGPPSFRERLCPCCAVMFQPKGPRGICVTCKQKGLREPVTFTVRRCACGASFTPDSPRRKACPDCRTPS